MLHLNSEVKETIQNGHIATSLAMGWVGSPRLGGLCWLTKTAKKSWSEITQKASAC